MMTHLVYKSAKFFFILLLSLIILHPATTLCKNTLSPTLFESGVSKELAQLRKGGISQLKYNLSFFIPQDKESPLRGKADILFNIDKQKYCHDLAIDFKTTSQKEIKSVYVNGREITVVLKNEHLMIPKKILKSGSNIIKILFNTNTSSLNRRDDFLYTLLVPDRARTLFPCFEQPDLKANYTLALTLPKEWEAIGNSNVKEETAGVSEEFNSLMQHGQGHEEQYKTIRFNETEPLSTYLFSFVAGKFYKSVQINNDSNLSVKSITIYHRSEEERERSQIPSIAHEVFEALKWMEKYTGVRYAFSKYDLILLPGFQFGGMEHTGATLYNVNQLFLPDNPTIDQKVRRTQLIAHETAHMWFGDLVTMTDFSEVWVKEVFANFFANLIVRPAHKEINYALNDLSFYKSAYREDRTNGANPIEQSLENIKYAGLIYGDIIYNKSPIALSLLFNLTGEKAFGKSLHNYLVKFKYGNASWGDIIAIFKENSTDCKRQIEEWNNRWILKPGMPAAQITNPVNGCGKPNVSYDLNGIQRLKIDTIEQAGQKFLVPNCNAKFYGKIVLDSSSIAIICKNLYSGKKPFDTPESRMASLMTLYENYLNKNIDAVFYAKTISGYLNKETNLQIFPSLLSYLSTVAYKEGNKKMNAEETVYEYIEYSIEEFLRKCEDEQLATYTFRTFYPLCKKRANIDTVYSIWESMKSTYKIRLNDSDYRGIAYELGMKISALGYMPKNNKEDRETIIKRLIDSQVKRIKNPDKIIEFKFVSQALSCNAEVRDSLFQLLLKAENRKPEPWALSLLSLLNHPLREKESQKYILPALKILPEVQRTGDIFMPKNWISSLLSSHHSPEAIRIVDEFLKRNAELPALLKNKILFIRYYM